MTFKDFLKYLENNLFGYQIFMNKAIQFQCVKNAKRPPKNRWEDKKIERAAAEMWKKSIEVLYNNLKREIKSDLPYSWTTYIEKHEILELVSESISELDFSEAAL